MSPSGLTFTRSSRAYSPRETRESTGKPFRVPHPAYPFGGCFSYPLFDVHLPHTGFANTGLKCSVPSTSFPHILRKTVPSTHTSSHVTTRTHILGDLVLSEFSEVFPTRLLAGFLVQVSPVRSFSIKWCCAVCPERSCKGQSGLARSATPLT